MKRELIALSSIAGLVCLALVGCGKPDSTTTTTEKISDAAGKASSATADAVKGATDAVKETADKAVAGAKDATKDLSAEASKQTQTLIDKAKTMLSEKNYQGVLDGLKKLQSMKLTPEQQKLVDDLKAQAQKLLASDATKSLPGVPK